MCINLHFHSFNFNSPVVSGLIQDSLQMMVFSLGLEHGVIRADKVANFAKIFACHYRSKVVCNMCLKILKWVLKQLKFSLHHRKCAQILAGYSLTAKSLLDTTLPPMNKRYLHGPGYTLSVTEDLVQVLGSQDVSQRGLS